MRIISLVFEVERLIIGTGNKTIKPDTVNISESNTLTAVGSEYRCINLSSGCDVFERLVYDFSIS